MRIFFLSFASGRFYGALDRIRREAEAFQLFDGIKTIRDTDLLENDPQFASTHGDFIRQNHRGFGYWIWKSYLVKKMMHEDMEEGDVLLYADSGCVLQLSGLERMKEYLEMARTSEHGVVSFALEGQLEKKWTKQDVFEHLGPVDYESRQIMATTFLMRKCKASMDFVDRWYATCCHYRLLDDSPSITPNHPEFSEHRHDQSIFSMLCKIMGSTVISDETYYHDWKDGNHAPILALRNCNG